MGKETALPKNIRQIGEIQGEEKVCIEDYVMTCIHKKEPQEKEGYLGIFFGERQQAEDGLYVFIRGILEIQAGWTADELKAKLEEQRQKYFPDWQMQGCCVLGQYRAERMRELEGQLPDAVQFIYHLQEQEENLYRTADGKYKKLKGYFIFYEQNRRMQQYLADEFKENSVEKESLPDKAIKSFREKVSSKGEKKTASMLRLASSFFVVTVLVIGAIVVTRVDDIRKVRTAAEKGIDAKQEETAGDIYMSPIQGGNKTASGGLTAAGASGTAQPDGAVQANSTAQLDGAMQANGTAQPDGAVQANSTAQLDGAVQANGTAQPDGAVQANGTAQFDGAVQANGTAQLDGAVQANGTAQESGTAQADGDVQANGTEQADGTVQANGTEQANGAAQPDVNGAAQPDGAEEANGATQASGMAQADSSSAGEDGSAGLDSGKLPSDSKSIPAEDDASAVSSRRTQASYTIRVGDTLADICSRYYGSLDKLDALCQANGITDADLIMPGQKIVLP